MKKLLAAGAPLEAAVTEHDFEGFTRAPLPAACCSVPARADRRTFAPSLTQPPAAALIWAAWNGRLEVLQTLIDAGANVDAADARSPTSTHPHPFTRSACHC